MGKLADLLVAYQAVVSLPWTPGLSSGERTWFVVYDPQDERRLRFQLGHFENATTHADHRWHMLDLASVFEQWMAKHEYSDSYFESPEDLQMALDSGFGDAVASRITAVTASLLEPERTVLALVGVGSLFGLVQLSRVLERVGRDVPGRLAVFFPGEFEAGNYRLLGARDGWSYLATPILAERSLL